MSNPKKRTAIPTSRGDLARLAFGKAREVLQDEKTQAMLVERGKSVATTAQQRYQDLRAFTAETDGSKGFGDHFGQRRVEGRIETLSASLDTLGRSRPDLAGALVPLNQAIAQLRLSVEIAGRLPLVKRTQAHLTLDRELDRLEQSLFEASLPAT
jgi:hypothetical protein